LTVNGPICVSQDTVVEIGCVDRIRSCRQLIMVCRCEQHSAFACAGVESCSGDDLPELGAERELAAPQVTGAGFRPRELPGSGAAAFVPAGIENQPAAYVSFARGPGLCHAPARGSATLGGYPSP
jgi:hypothetical protein